MKKEVTQTVTRKRGETSPLKKKSKEPRKMISISDTERIIRVLGVIRETWLENPKLRLMQLLLNVCDRDTETEVFLAAKLATRAVYFPDPCFMDDKMLLSKIVTQYSSTQHKGKKSKVEDYP